MLYLPPVLKNKQTKNPKSTKLISVLEHNFLLAIPY